MHNIEYRYKGKIGTPDETSYRMSKWYDDLNPMYNLDDINFSIYSIRIDGIIYHRKDTKGLKEAFGKAILWMRLNRNPDKDYVELW